MTGGEGLALDQRPGTLVAGGQYRVLERLGQGGFGTVYLVETIVGGLRRALKVLHPELAADEGARRRFVNEAVVLEQLNHPHIARCFAAGTLGDGEAPYLLLEYVDGVPLADLVRGPDGAPQPLPPLRAVRLARQIAAGLVAVHARRLLHRDLTTRNVLVERAGEPDEHVRLVDFGIAGVLDGRTHTAAAAIGTPAFMAPEQFDRGCELDARADLWQLGALLHVMLTGRTPYGSDDGSIAGLIAAHRAHATAGPAPSALVPALAAWPEVSALVQRLLAADRTERPASALETCEELARIQHLLHPSQGADAALAMLDALCAHPSEDGWWALVRFLDGHPEAARLGAAAAPRLRHWPDALRRAPLVWWDRARRGDAPAAWMLVRTLDLSGRGIDDPAAAQLAQCQALADLTALDLSHNLLGPEGAAAIAASPWLAALVELDATENRLGSDGAAHLASAAGLSALRRLHLADNGIGPAGGEALAKGALRLTTLDLARNQLGAAGAAAIAGSAVLSALQTLDLRDNALGADGASAVALSRCLSELRELEIGGNDLGAAGAAALALARNFPELSRLGLSRNRLGVEGLELLAGAPRFGALVDLDLAANGVGPRGMLVLAAAPLVRRVRHLDVADNDLGDAGLAAMVGAPYLSALRTAALGRNGLTATGLALLSGAPAELERLDLTGNPLGDDGAGVLAHLLPRLPVRSLGLADCGMSGRGLATILAAAPSGLAHLSLSGNAVDASGAMELAAAAAARPASLELARTGLGVDGLTALARSPFGHRLRRLVLDGALRGAEPRAAADALAALPALRTLSLRETDAGDALVTALTGSPVAARLEDLDLAFNPVGDAGAAPIADGGWPALRRLRLDHTRISIAAAASIWASPHLPTLHRASCAHATLEGAVDLHSLGRHQVALLERSLGWLAPRLPDVAAAFYARLFTRYPSVKPLFARTSMRRQQQHLATALTMVIDHLRAPEAAGTQLRALGARHVAYGACPSHYPAVCGVLLDVLREHAGGQWSDDVDDAWYDGLAAVAAAMEDGARDARAAVDAGTEHPAAASAMIGG
ncbi:MAG: protein kinase [Vicinamibacterales bacterium]